MSDLYPYGDPEFGAAPPSSDVPSSSHSPRGSRPRLMS